MHALVLVPLGRNPPDIQGLEVEHWANSTKTILTWNQNEINESHVDIEISQFDFFEFRLHPASLASFKHVPNSGSYYLDFSEENISSRTRRRKRNSNTVSEIAIVGITPSLSRVKRFGIISRVALFSAVFLVTWLVDINHPCENWYQSQDVGKIARLQGNPKEKDSFSLRFWKASTKIQAH
ncbi:Hypothetical predicted protein [Paramuricea clavata]|uniref:Uncharacterized protein n=1 Tax=Paramuricea clavata TaxID=317549 RepID=A0A6S7IFY1_PARCT|nr:Hypothetical predicted protein [Paramuricea clavata]